jgi:hypothetical protein
MADKLKWRMNQNGELIYTFFEMLYFFLLYLRPIFFFYFHRRPNSRWTVKRFDRLKLVNLIILKFFSRLFKFG